MPDPRPLGAPVPAGKAVFVGATGTLTLYDHGSFPQTRMSSSSRSIYTPVPMISTDEAQRSHRL